MVIGKLIYIVKEIKYLAIILQKPNYRLIKSGNFLVRLISSGVVGTPAIKDIPSTVA